MIRLPGGGGRPGGGAAMAVRVVCGALAAMLVPVAVGVAGSPGIGGASDLPVGASGSLIPAPGSPVTATDLPVAVANSPVARGALPVARGASPVADAAQRGDLDAVRRLLRDGADVNAPQGDGMTALHWAAERGDGPLCEVLLYAGARVDAGTRIGHYTPLHLAARAGSVALVEMLMEAGSDPGAATTNSGATPLHLAAASGDPRVIEVLAAGGADVNAREAAWGQTPLIFAAAANRVAAIEALLAAGADPSLTAHVVDVEEQSDADAAAERRLNEFIAAFREKEGGGPDWQPTPSQVQAAIEAAREIQRRWPDVPDPADDNAEEAEGDQEGEAGQEAQLADQEGQVAGEEDATLSGENPDSAEAVAEADSTQNTQNTQNTESTEGEDPSDEDEEPRPLSYAQTIGAWGGLTPLLHAVRQGHTEVALVLLAGGADINQPSAGDRTTPLLMAAVNGQFDLAALLLDRGADPNLASQAGTTPLYAVLERQWAPRASYSHPTEHLHQHSTYLELMQALLDAGADPNARLASHLWYMEYTFGVLRGSGINLKGATPFWRAAYALDVDAMRLLKDHGADPGIATMKPPQRRRRQAPAEEEEEEEEEMDPSGLPPVPSGGPAIHPIHAASGVGYGQSFAGNAHRHVPDNWMAAVRFLVEECGADVNARDANASTPLHHAASRGDIEMIFYLIGHGADVTALNRRGQTTADMANGPVQRVQPFPATVVLLEKLGSKNTHRCQSC
ncbi:MAG: ankyrin repeat domain-containing protein [Gemmatimonadetes bacterium]|nr:ankyrin repeat domain-containing protein [Gemmatimonadota bacterium]